MIFLFLRVSHQQANTAPAQHSWLGRWVYVALSKAALLTKIQKEHSQFLSQPRMYFKACSSQNRCLSPRVPHNLVLAKAVPQQGHWTTSFRLHHRCKSVQKVLSPSLSFANYLWRPKAPPNLESCLRHWQVQSTSNKWARKPTTRVNQFAYWKWVSDCA